LNAGADDLDWLYQMIFHPVGTCFDGLFLNFIGK